MQYQKINIEPSEEMKNLFIKRMSYHRTLVQNSLIKMVGYQGLTWSELGSRALTHDQSKFEMPECTAYTWMTWMYHCQQNQIAFQYPPGISDLVNLGWQHHIHHNLHHPEAHKDPNTMDILDLIEMVADWMAISQENHQSVHNCLTWAKANIDNKWQFSMTKKQFIFTTIQELAARLSQHEV